MKFLISLLSLLLVLGTSTSIATTAGGGKGLEDGMFWGADLNRNEQLDREEAKSVYNLAEDEIFIRYDENGDGQINRVEFMEFMQQSPWTKKFVPPKN